MKRQLLPIFILFTLAVNMAAQSVSPVIPVGTEIQVRVNENLTSETAQAGDQFTGTLVNSIEDMYSNIIFGRGSYISGTVISAKPSGRLSDSGELVLLINNIRSGSKSANLTVGPYTLTGGSHTGSNTAKIGGGAVLGAIIGGMAGGGKGAAIGAGAGTAAGTGAAAATGKRNAKVDSESVLRFVTSTDANIVANGSTSTVNQSQTQSPSAPGNDIELQRRDNPPSTLASNQVPAAVASAPTSTSATDIATFSAPSTPSTSANANNFSARDRRVIKMCLVENPVSDAAAQRSTPLERNSTLPSAVQRKAKSLPLACERQLPTLSNDLERVTYSGQVMLIDANNRILDIFQLSPQ
ncbi:MAG: hypothetical protein JWN45_1708 [Acidobacteriaceae bacterium]|jgi:hypothetical protein|nr:hypothetical protein [Acidobacteriaceae bacterium]